MYLIFMNKRKKVAPLGLNKLVCLCFYHKLAPTELKCRRHGHLVIYNKNTNPKSRRDNLMVKGIKGIGTKSYMDDLIVIPKEKVAPLGLNSFVLPAFNHKSAPMGLKCRRHGHLVIYNKNTKPKSRRDDLLVIPPKAKTAPMEIISWQLNLPTISSLLLSYAIPFRDELMGKKQ